MLPDSVRKFAAENHQAVLTTFRKSGDAQMSIVTVGPYGDGIAFTTTGRTVKLANLKRDPRCSLLVSRDNWWGFFVLQGRANVMFSDNTDREVLRLALRDVYRAASGQEHPDWDEYDQAMVDDRRAAVVVVPDRVYGTAEQVQ